MPTLDPSNKRFLALLLGSLVAALNRKLGLELPESEVLAIVSLIGGYILTSKAGEAVVAHAEARGAVAAAEIATIEQADAVIANAIAPVPVAPVVPVKK